MFDKNVDKCYFCLNTKTRDVVIGLIVLVILISGALIIRNNRKAVSINTPLPTPNFQKVENNFPSIKVPANADRIDLKAISIDGGMGEAFRTYQNGKINLTVMANMQDIKPGYFYQAWLTKDNTTNLSLGKMTFAKGGYISEFDANKDYSDHKRVMVTLERVFDNSPETLVLEGSF